MCDVLERERERERDERGRGGIGRKREWREGGRYREGGGERGRKGERERECEGNIDREARESLNIQVMLLADTNSKISIIPNMFNFDQHNKQTASVKLAPFPDN